MSNLKIKVIDYRGEERTDTIHAFGHHGPYLDKMRELMSPTNGEPRSEVTRTVVRIYPAEGELF